jgi:hypothetical protein
MGSNPSNATTIAANTVIEESGSPIGLPAKLPQAPAIR